LQGKRGHIGPKGERGPPGLNIKGWKYEPEHYVLTPIMEGGYEGSPANLRPFFEQYDAERGA
jgi:hypothetical protein